MAGMEAMRALHLQQYHQLFLSKGTRVDGRRFENWRPIEVTLSPLDSADGSAVVRLGNTTVMCGVKGTIVPPTAEELNQGIIEVTTKLPPNILHGFKWSRDASTDQETCLSAKLTKILTSSGCLDLKQLVIKDGEHVWRLEIEVICLDFDGNILDASLAAIVGCLLKTTLPVVSSTPGNDSNMFSFSEERAPLSIKSIPLSSTFSLIKKEILFVDPTAEEETLSEGFVSIVSSPDGVIFSVEKEGLVTITQEELISLMNKSKERSRSLLSILSPK